ncbi:MAG: hypothetical protein NVS9B3_11450 [Gemmatimonadaceae bacterium]
MRPLVAALTAALVVAGCSSGTNNAPAPQRIEPLRVVLGRPVGEQIVVQTNHRAFLAVFEIVPRRGVVMIYPSTASERWVEMWGTSWLTYPWTAERAVYDVIDLPTARSQRTRYFYALAAESPLALPDAVFEPGYLSRSLGWEFFVAESPYPTMRTLSQRFLPRVPAHGWAEDVVVVPPVGRSGQSTIARVYCPGGQVYEAPEEMISRISCPYRRTRRAPTGPDAEPSDRPVTIARPPIHPDSVIVTGSSRPGSPEDGDDDRERRRGRRGNDRDGARDNNRDNTRRVADKPQIQQQGQGPGLQVD